MRELLQVMNLEPLQLVAVMVTSDGFYLGRERGDIGFNAFLGMPRPGSFAVSESWRKFRGLNLAGRKGVVRAARASNVRLRTFLPR